MVSQNLSIYYPQLASSSIALTFIVFNLSKSLDDLVHVQHI